MDCNLKLLCCYVRYDMHIHYLLILNSDNFTITNSWIIVDFLYSMQVYSMQKIFAI